MFVYQEINLILLIIYHGFICENMLYCKLILNKLSYDNFDMPKIYVNGKEQIMLKYNEFIEKVNEAGFLTPFTNYIDPEIFKFSWDGCNLNGQAYTGDPETDPTKWSARAAQERKLAYGYFFSGKPGGYIAPRFYSIFIDAFKPRMTVEERHETGKLDEQEWNVWNVFNKTEGPIGWSQIWQYYGIKDTVERRKLDTALKNLQITFDISYTGIGYSKVDNWVSAEWMQMNPRMEQEEALEIIYRQAEKISNTGDAKKAFNKSLKLYKSFC